MPTSDTRARTAALVDAYLEMLLGVFALRLPPVQAALGGQPMPIAIKSSYAHQDVIIDAAQMVSAIQREQAGKLQAAVWQIARIFVATMWDVLTGHQLYGAISTAPEVQLFRHLRHACAHDGTFNFSELKHPARWRDKELTVAHRGTAAFPIFFNDGDLLLLFLDIDQKYFGGPGVAAYLRHDET